MLRNMAHSMSDTVGEDNRELRGPSEELFVELLPDGGAVVVVLDVTESRSLERMRCEFVANEGAIAVSGVRRLSGFRP